MPVTPEIASDGNQFVEVARFGTGRAVLADATETTTVIATTIGVIVRRGQDETAIPTALPQPISGVDLAPDSASVLLIGQAGASELWSIGSDPALLGSFDDTLAARFTDNSTAIDLVHADIVERVSTAPGLGEISAVVPVTAPAAHIAWIGPDGEPVAFSERSGGSGVGWTWNGDAGSTALEADIDGSIARVVGDPTSSRAVLGIEHDGRADTLEMVDARTGAIEWAHDGGSVASGSRWDVGADGRVLVVADMDAQLLGTDGAVVATLQLDGVESVVAVRALAPAAGFAIVRTRGSIVFVGADGELVASVPSSGSRLVDVEPIATSGSVVTVDFDGAVRRVGPSGVESEGRDHVAGAVNEVAVSADGTTAAAASSDGTVRVLDLVGADGTVTASRDLAHTEGNVDSVTFAPDGSFVVSGISEPNGRNTFDDSMIRWNLSDDERQFTVAGIPQPIMGCTEFRNTVRVSPDGSFFVAPFHDFTVSMRSTDDGAVIHEFPPHVSIVWGVAISPDGTHLVTSSDDWTVRVWDLDTYRLSAEYDVAPGGFLAIDYLPDGHRVVVSDITGTIRILDLDDGSLSAPFQGEKLHEARLSVSPDGRYVAAGSMAVGRISVWDTATGAVVSDLAGHTGDVESVVFTPDGRGLVSGSSDGTVRLWQLP